MSRLRKLISALCGGVTDATTSCKHDWCDASSSSWAGAQKVTAYPGGNLPFQVSMKDITLEMIPRCGLLKENFSGA
jgi:hypothetical protein